MLSLAMGAALALAGPGLECQDAHVAVRHSPREGSPFIGPPDATDTLVLFTDYQ